MVKTGKNRDSGAVEKEKWCEISLPTWLEILAGIRQGSLNIEDESIEDFNDDSVS